MILYVTRPDGSRAIVDDEEPEDWYNVDTINGWYSTDQGLEYFLHEGVSYYSKIKSCDKYISHELGIEFSSRKECERHFALKAFW